MSMTIDDADLIRSFKSGNHEAFDAIVSEYQGELLRHARRRAKDAGTAEDLVQEAFIRAFRAFGRLEDDSCVRPWLHQILANVCIDEANRRNRDDDKTERFSCDASAPLVGPSIEQQLGLNIDDHGLERALADLPDTHRDAFTMRFVDELDYDEIAAATGVTEPNARARVSRARSAMRRAMQGAAVVPMAFYLLLRRPGKNALAAAPPSDPMAALKASESVSAASRMAVTLQPALDAANAVAVNAPATAPLLTKAAVGIGSLAVAFSAAPEQPPPRPDPVVAQALAPQSTIETTQPPVEADAPVVMITVAAPVTTSAPATTLAATTTVTIATTVMTIPVTITSVTTLAAAVPVTAPVASTTIATTIPATTLPPVTTPPTTLPPLTGGSFSSSGSVVSAGPRLDLSGSATLNVAGSAMSGSMSGRIGVEAPDPQGSHRIDGTLTVQLESGSVDIRIAGYATSPDAPVAGLTPTNLNMSGMYRASGATGRLALAGTFSASLSGGTMTLTLSA
jgi:RNA polymerase sigma-70 factor (ECF subfamily)